MEKVEGTCVSVVTAMLETEPKRFKGTASSPTLGNKWGAGSPLLWSLCCSYKTLWCVRSFAGIDAEKVITFRNNRAAKLERTTLFAGNCMFRYAARNPLANKLVLLQAVAMNSQITFSSKLWITILHTRAFRRHIIPVKRRVYNI